MATFNVGDRVTVMDRHAMAFQHASALAALAPSARSYWLQASLDDAGWTGTVVQVEASGLVRVEIPGAPLVDLWTDSAFLFLAQPTAPPAPPPAPATAPGPPPANSVMSNLRWTWLPGGITFGCPTRRA